MTSHTARWLALVVCIGIVPACGKHHHGGGAPHPRGGGDTPPTVSITSPSPGDAFPAGSTIVIRGDASDADGIVTRVDFFQGSTLLATSTQAPFFFTWTNVAAGSYSLTAVAIDNGGMSTRSEPVGITVTPPIGPINQPPVVSITSPASGTILPSPASFTIVAQASDPDGTVVKVDFFNGTSLIGTSTTPPFAVTFSNVQPGTYSISAVATDNGGASTTSSPITVIVDEAPTVLITSPPGNSTFTAPATIVIDARADDTDGTVVRVDFFQNGGLIGTSISAPFSITWSNVPTGSYSLTAVATDNGGIQSTSSPVPITVTAPTSSAGWRLQTSGTDNTLNGVSFVDTMNGWAVGEKGTILRTTDGGATWSSQANPVGGTDASLLKVRFVDIFRGWAVGTNGTLLITTDGGTTWTLNKFAMTGSLRHLQFRDAMNGWMVGDSANVFKTTDGGVTWTALPMGVTRGTFTAVKFVDAQNGWIAGSIPFLDDSRAAIFRTSDGGTTWTQQFMADTHFTFLSGMDFVNLTTGWAVGEGSLSGATQIILATTDGGSTWFHQTSHPATSGEDVGPLAVQFVNPTTGWAVGAWHSIVATTNAGATWTEQSAPTPVDHWFFDLSFVNDQTGWAVGTAGTIIKTTTGGRGS